MQVVFRIEKLKSWSAVGSSGAHNHRLRETQNADPSKKNIEILGPPPGVTVVEFAKEKLKDTKIRSNAVLGVEVLLTASPEFFRPDDPKKYGHYDESKLKAWREVTEPWIKKKFPHAVSVVLHLDEATPHYHIIDLPLDARGKLNCREKFGGRETLAQWQTEAAKVVETLGLERGLPGSKATHTAVKKYYGAAMRSAKELGVEVPKVKTKTPPPLPPATITERIPGTESHRERVNKEEKRKAQLAARAAEVAEQRKAVFTAFPQIAEKAKGIDLANSAQREAESKAASLAKENAALKKELADRVRGLPLEEVLTRLYGAELDKDSREHHTTKKYKVGEGSIAVTKKVGGEVWYDQRANKGGKGAIDLVMHADGIDYRQAVKLLSESFGAKAMLNEVQIVPPAAKQIVESAIKTPAVVPEHAPTRWPRVKAFLIEQRKLPEKLVDWLRKVDRLRADMFNNAVFPRDKGGAFVRGTGQTKFHRAYGGKECGPFTLPGAVGGKVILCESAIDACSLKALHAGATVHALGGNLLRPADVKELVPGGAEVLLAFDADSQGQQFNIEAKQVWPNAQQLELPPGVKDWNEALQRGAETPAPQWQSEAQKKALEAAKAAEAAKRAAEAEEARLDAAQRAQYEREASQRALSQTRARPKA
jgi:5S rRNA maturation endonuclease (ribonuclease M5)